MNFRNYATQSELTFLGGLLLEPSLFGIYKEILCEADFYHKKSKEVFRAMKELNAKHLCFDCAMVVDFCGYSNQEDIEAVYELANSCPSTANLDAHASIIREKSVQRQLIECRNDQECRDEQIERDFNDFAYTIHPHTDGAGVINLTLLCTHRVSKNNTNLFIDPDSLKQYGYGYLFGLMSSLTAVLKQKMSLANASRNDFEYKN